MSAIQITPLQLLDMELQLRRYAHIDSRTFSPRAPLTSRPSPALAGIAPDLGQPFSMDEEDELEARRRWA